MAKLNVTQLPEKITIADDDLFYIVDSGQVSDKKVKFSTAKNNIRPAKSCAGTLEQAGADDPVQLTMGNNLGGDVTITRNNEGIYLFSSASLFTNGKTILLINASVNANPSFIVFDYFHDDESTITLYCYNAVTGRLTDINSANPIPFKIEVYN